MTTFLVVCRTGGSGRSIPIGSTAWIDGYLDRMRLRNSGLRNEINRVLMASLDPFSALETGGIICRATEIDLARYHVARALELAPKPAGSLKLYRRSMPGFHASFDKQLLSDCWRFGPKGAELDDGGVNEGEELPSAGDERDLAGLSRCDQASTGPSDFRRIVGRFAASRQCPLKSLWRSVRDFLGSISDRSSALLIARYKLD